MSFFVGLDGGGTRTTVVVVDERGVERSRIHGPPTLVRGAQPERVAGVIASTVLEALERTAGGSADVLCCALAGAGRAEERERLLAALGGAGLASRVVIIGDAEAALADAFDGGPGMLLIAGTGSIAVARSHDGALLRVGGWGDILGDEGSGFALGTAALRAVARAADGRGAETALSGEILLFAGVAEPAGLIRWAAAASKGHIAALAPLVCRVAVDGDPTAEELVDGAVSDLVDHIAALVPRLGLDPSATPDIALSGGLLQEGSPVRTRLIQQLDSLGVRVVQRSVDAALGAAKIAGAPL